MSDELELFGQMMPRDWAEMLIASQQETHYRDADGEYKRIPYGKDKGHILNNKYLK